MSSAHAGATQRGYAADKLLQLFVFTQVATPEIGRDGPRCHHVGPDAAWPHLLGNVSG